MVRDLVPATVLGSDCCYEVPLVSAWRTTVQFFVGNLGCSILARRHRDDNVLTLFTVSFGHLQDKLALVQTEVRCFSDGKENGMLVVFGPDKIDHTVGLHSVIPGIAALGSSCAARQSRRFHRQHSCCPFPAIRTTSIPSAGSCRSDRCPFMIDLHLGLTWCDECVQSGRRPAEAGWNGKPTAKTRTRHQDRRRFLSEARAAPPPIFGLMTNSRTVTLESVT